MKQTLCARSRFSGGSPMKISNQPMRKRYTSCFQTLLFTMIVLGCVIAHSQSTPVTNIEISNAVQQASVHRLGVNLGDQTYFDSGQIMKNLIFNNPGFEGLRYRMIYKCSKITANSCQD